MSRVDEARDRLDAALRRLAAALDVADGSARAATESRDRKIAALVAELSGLRQDRDALGQVADLAALRIDAVIDRLRASAES